MSHLISSSEKVNVFEIFLFLGPAFFPLFQQCKIVTLGLPLNFDDVFCLKEKIHIYGLRVWGELHCGAVCDSHSPFRRAGVEAGQGGGRQDGPGGEPPEAGGGRPAVLRAEFCPHEEGGQRL